MKEGVSVVVCTYNGDKRLPDTLRHLAQQQVRHDIPWEVIVIDNASTDNTSQTVLEEWSKYQCSGHFSLLVQPKLGLTYARELALEKAQFNYILFCDDDNWLYENYVNTAYDIMLQHASIGVLGGYGILEYETPPPGWAASYTMFANGPQATVSGKVRRNVVYGAGCVIRKSAYDMVHRAGFKPMLTDRLAANLSSGGDHEFCYALALAGYDIWYDERLKFKHFMPKERITQEYYTRFFEENAKALEVLLPYNIIVNYGGKCMLSFHFQLLRRFMGLGKLMIPVILNKVKLSTQTEAEQLNLLKFKSLKARMLSFRRYSSMRKNFFQILKFKQENLAVAAVKEPEPIQALYMERT
jgi:glycosyltransferase involved in cell wall biosynthesis